MFAPSQICILLGATGVLLRLPFAATLRLAYGIRLLGATDPWTIAAFAADTLAIFERRVQTRLHCTHQIYGRVQGVNFCAIGTVLCLLPPDIDSNYLGKN